MDFFKTNKDQILLGKTSWKFWLTTRKQKKKRKTTKEVILWHGNRSHTRWDMINLVGYRVLMTYYYIPSFLMVWTEVWLYSPNKVIKFHQLKQNKNIFRWLVHTTYSTFVLMQIYMLSLKVHVFSEKKKDQIPMKTSVTQVIWLLRMPVLQFH